MNFSVSKSWGESLFNDTEQSENAIGQSSDWRIEAGEVTILKGDQPRVTGSFQVIAPTDSMTSESPNQGGACLIADLTPFGVGLEHCSSNLECNSSESIDTENHPEYKDFYGYCIERDGDTARCWTWPGAATNYCQRTRDSLRLTEGTHELQVVAANPLESDQSLPEWAIYACISHPGYDTACGETDSEHRQTSMTQKQ